MAYYKNVNGEHRVYFDSPEEAQFAQAIKDHQLSYETDRQKELLLSIAKKVYTKMRESRRIPMDVVESFGKDIRERNWFNLSMNCSKPMLATLAKLL